MLSNLPYNYFPEIDCNYLIFSNNNVIYAINGTTKSVDFSGTDVSIVIQNAINNLTSNRTSQEKIFIKGNFTINSKISVPAYTDIELCGKLTLGTSVHLFESSSLVNAVDRVSIHGGELNGNNHSKDGIRGTFLSSKFYNLYIDGFDNGIHAMRGSNSQFQECKIFNNRIGTWYNTSGNNIGLLMDVGATDNNIYSNVFSKNTNYAIKCSASNNRFTNNHMWCTASNTDAGLVYLYTESGLTGVIFNFNYLDTCYANGVLIDANNSNIRGLIFSNNIFWRNGVGINNTYDAIQLKRTGTTYNISKCIFSGNYFGSNHGNKPRYAINDIQSSIITNNMYINNCIENVVTGAINITSSLDDVISNNGHIQDPKSSLLEKIASANVRNSHDTEIAAFTHSEYTKKKTINILNGLLGQCRILFDIKSDDGINTVYGRIYKNGIALGAEQTTTNSSYQTKSENITQDYQPGDTLELWCYAENSANISIRNFRLAYDNSPTITVVCNYN